MKMSEEPDRYAHMRRNEATKQRALDRGLVIQAAAILLAGYLADGQTSTVTSAIAQSMVDWARLIIEKVDQKP
jgi:hypothetical protein